MPRLSWRLELPVMSKSEVDSFDVWLRLGCSGSGSASSGVASSVSGAWGGAP